MAVHVEREGVVRCIREPRCECGLEGYDFGREYRYQLMRGDRGGRYVRVYPEGPDGASPNYYETCGPKEFERYFEVVASWGCADDDEDKA